MHNYNNNKINSMSTILAMYTLCSKHFYLH